MQFISLNTRLHGYHHHWNHFCDEFTIFEYQADVGCFGTCFGASSDRSSCKIYLLTLIPDYIAPSIYPCETRAVSVPAQWILPSGLLRLLILVSTPGGVKQTGPPCKLLCSFQTLVVTSIGANISAHLQYCASFSVTVLSNIFLSPVHSSSIAPQTKTAMPGCTFPSSLMRESSQAMVMGPSTPSVRTQPLSPRSLQYCLSQSRMHLEQAPMQQRSHMSLRSLESWGSNSTFLMVLGGIAITRQSASQESPFLACTLTPSALCYTRETQVSKTILPFFFSISSLRKQLRYWVPFFNFLSCSPFSILQRQSSPKFWCTYHKKNKKLTQLVQHPMILRTHSYISFFTLSNHTFCMIQVCTVMESHATAWGQERGSSRGTFLAMRSICHIAHCRLSSGITPTLKGMLVLYGISFFLSQRILVPV